MFFVCLGRLTFSFFLVILPVPPPPKSSCVNVQPLTIAKDITAAPNSSVDSIDYTRPFSIGTQFVSGITNHFTSGFILPVTCATLEFAIRWDWKLITLFYCKITIRKTGRI